MALPASSDADSPPFNALSPHLRTVQRAIGFVAGREGLSRDDADDFASVVFLRLLEHDGAVIRKFEGRSSFHTFLVVVVQRIFLDYRNAQWGRWRPSAEARRLGPAAVRLDTLISRDRLSSSEAREILRREGTPDAEIETWLQALPARPRRTFVGEDQLALLPAPPAEIDQALLRQQADQTLLALRAALARLAPDERKVLRLRFVERLKVGEIAAQCGVDVKPLYRRIERLLRRLRTDLEATGVSRRELWGWLGRIEIDGPGASRFGARSRTPTH